MKYAALVAALIALSATAATAQDARPIVSFGEIGYGGSGCPDSTATIVTNDARTSALLSLSDYTVGDANRSLDRKTCALAVPTSVPDGVAVAIRGVAVIGSVELPEGLEATLGLEAFVTGEVGEVTELTLTGLRAGNWQRTIVIPWDKLVWTGCGDDNNLRVNTSLRTRGKENAKVTVDTVTLFRLATKAC
jgi:hypothetical protein